MPEYAEQTPTPKRSDNEDWVKMFCERNRAVRQRDRLAAMIPCTCQHCSDCEPCDRCKVLMGELD